MGFPGGSDGKESASAFSFSLWVGKIPWSVCIYILFHLAIFILLGFFIVLQTFLVSLPPF